MTDLDPVADCTCPTKYDDAQRIVRAGTDQRCPQHGWQSRALPHCPTCTCLVGSPIVQRNEGPKVENNDAQS